MVLRWKRKGGENGFFSDGFFSDGFFSVGFFSFLDFKKPTSPARVGLDGDLAKFLSEHSLT